MERGRAVGMGALPVGSEIVFFLYGRTSFKRLRDCELALLGVSNAPKMTF